MATKVAGGLVVAFVLFYIVASPDHAEQLAHGIGHLAQGFWHLVVKIANAIKKLVDGFTS